MVGVLFFVVVVPGQVQDAETANVGDNRQRKVLPKLLEEDRFSAAILGDGNFFELETVHDGRQNHCARQDDVGAIAIEPWYLLSFIERKVA